MRWLLAVALFAGAALPACGPASGPPPSPTVRVVPPITTPTPAPAHPGKRVFRMACSACHVAEGPANTTLDGPHLDGLWTRIWLTEPGTHLDRIGNARESMRLSTALYRARRDSLKADHPAHYEANRERLDRVLAAPEGRERFAVWLECRIESGSFDAPGIAMNVTHRFAGNEFDALIDYLMTLTE